MFENSKKSEVAVMGNGNEIWHAFTSFQSASVAQKYLKRSYEKAGIDQPELKSYDNCYPFIYYIAHGKKYYHLAEQSPVELKPILLFYGMIQLVKACLLTVDPSYPQNTNVLAHGVSTRKRKKKNYSFFDDEVRIQKHGLLNHFADKLFCQNPLWPDRIKMKTLLAKIPELNETFHQIKEKRPLVHVKTSDRNIVIPLMILDELNMTEQRFVQFLASRSTLRLSSFYTERGWMTIDCQHGLSPLNALPFVFHMEKGFFLPTDRELYEPLHEVIVQYLLLYNLSMICRYETEWWNELFHTYSSDDLPFIQQFLTITSTKIPYLLSEYLLERNKSKIGK